VILAILIFSVLGWAEFGQNLLSNPLFQTSIDHCEVPNPLSTDKYLVFSEASNPLFFGWTYRGASGGLFSLQISNFILHRVFAAFGHIHISPIPH